MEAIHAKKEELPDVDSTLLLGHDCALLLSLLFTVKSIRTFDRQRLAQQPARPALATGRPVSRSHVALSNARENKDPHTSPNKPTPVSNLAPLPSPIKRSEQPAKRAREASDAFDPIENSDDDFADARIKPVAVRPRVMFGGADSFNPYGTGSKSASPNSVERWYRPPLTPSNQIKVRTMHWNVAILCRPPKKPTRTHHSHYPTRGAQTLQS